MSGKYVSESTRIFQINSLDNIEFVKWVDGYKNKKSKAIVKCSIDGFQWESGIENLIYQGNGCPNCCGKRRWTQAERIEHFNMTGKMKFIDWVDCYKDKNSKAIVRCIVDGFEWVVTPNSVMNMGSGCPKCAKSGYDPSKAGYLYALRSECGGYVKVGKSNNPTQRYRKLKRATPMNFSVIEQICLDGSLVGARERYFHEKYVSAGFVGFDGATEWLTCTDELLNELRMERNRGLQCV